MKNRLTQIKTKLIEHRAVVACVVITAPIIISQGKNIIILNNFVEKKGLMEELLTGVATVVAE
jgi:hypothetical protein